VPRIRDHRPSNRHIACAAPVRAAESGSCDSGVWTRRHAHSFVLPLLLPENLRANAAAAACGPGERPMLRPRARAHRGTLAHEECMMRPRQLTSLFGTYLPVFRPKAVGSLPPASAPMCAWGMTDSPRERHALRANPPPARLRCVVLTQRWAPPPGPASAGCTPVVPFLQSVHYAADVCGRCRPRAIRLHYYRWSCMRQRC